MFYTFTKNTSRKIDHAMHAKGMELVKVQLDAVQASNKQLCNANTKENLHLHAFHHKIFTLSLVFRMCIFAVILIP